MLNDRAFEHEPTTTLRIDRAMLADAINQAFVESRFGEPPQPEYVNIHANGAVLISRSGLYVTCPGTSLLAVECFGCPDLPANAMPENAPWSREEFKEWVASRDDLYLVPVLKEMNYLASKKGIRIELLG